MVLRDVTCKGMLNIAVTSFIERTQNAKYDHNVGTLKLLRFFELYRFIIKYSLPNSTN
jgi:hypothetical protein